MKYLLILATLLCTGVYVGEANGDEPKAPSRKVIQVPNPKFTRPAPQRPRPQTPNTQRPLPKGFGVPIQRPQGFGKQEWQKPQQPIPQQQPRVQTRHSFGVYNYYYYTPNPYFNRYYRVPAYRPPVIIQPQPMPIYPSPFHSFFFHFRW